MGWPDGYAAESMRLMQTTKLRSQTARAWLERHYQQQYLLLFVRQRDASTLVVQAVEAAYRSGRASQSDVFAARMAVARLEDRLLELRVDQTNAETSLSRWIGDTDRRPMGPLPNLNRLRSSLAAGGTELDRLPDIALMGARENAAQAEAEVSRHERSPDWSWSLMYGKREGKFSDMVSLGVSVPLQWDQGNRQDRELAAKLEKVEQIRAEREELHRERLAEIERQIASWRNNLVRLAEYDNTLVPLAAARTQATEAAYRSAKAPLSAVLSDSRMELDTQMERLRIEKQTAFLWAELEFLLPPSQLSDAPLVSTSVVSHQESSQ